MEENQISRTALGTAYMRAYHAMHDSPKIFDDFLAYHFFRMRYARASNRKWRSLSSYMTLYAQRRALIRRPPWRV